MQAPTNTTPVLLSGSGRQLRPAEPPGDADADADAEEEDSVSFLVLNFSVMTVWQNGILNILFMARSCWWFSFPLKMLYFCLGLSWQLKTWKDVSV